MTEHKYDFTKNIIMVFSGTSLAHLFNLLYQLLIAHNFSPADFAAFNSLLSIFTLISVPLSTFQLATAKYTAQFNAASQTQKIKPLLSGLLMISAALAVLLFFVFSFISFYLADKLKIYSFWAPYILAGMLSLACVLPVLLGGLQGLELFKWYTAAFLISGLSKLILASIFILLGFQIAGALGAFLLSSFFWLVFSYLPLRKLISLRFEINEINLKEIILYLFPAAFTSFCLMGLISFDMILVRYFFTSLESGFYALSQMVGKIFFFLPYAISIVMFPRVSGLNAKDMDTHPTLEKSLLYTALLCLGAIITYNIFPALTLKVLTGKAFTESIVLGRLFSISMSFFALLYIIVYYFLSIKDLRFIKYLVIFTILQFILILLFHRNLIQVQLILCANSILLFLIHLILAYSHKRAVLIR